MKNLSYVTILVIAFFMVSTKSNARVLRNGFNAYEITSVDDLHMGKDVKAIWTVSYSKTEEPITVVKRKTMEGMEYVVQGEYFALSYACTANGFGAKEVRKSWTSVPKKITRAVINKDELAKQEIITPNKVDDQRALGLIASYLPELINDSYTHLLN